MQTILQTVAAPHLDGVNLLLDQRHVEVVLLLVAVEHVQAEVVIIGHLLVKVGIVNILVTEQTVRIVVGVSVTRTLILLRVVILFVGLGLPLPLGSFLHRSDRFGPKGLSIKTYSILDGGGLDGLKLKIALKYE